MAFTLQCTPTSADEFAVLTAALDTTTKRNGFASIRCTPVTTGTKYASLVTSAYVPDANTDIIALSGTGYVRFYINIATLPAASDEQIISFWGAGGSTRCQLRINSAGNLAVYDATPSLIATGSTALSTATWYRIEVKLTLSATGTFDVLLDGVSEISSGSVNLSAGSVRIINIGKRANFNGQGYDIYFSDFLVSDSAYPGAGQGAYAIVTGAGNYSGWTTGTGSTFAEVDELPNDGDTTYIGTSSIAASTFAHQSFATIGGSGTINCVKAVSVVRDEAGTTAVANRFRSGTTDSDTATKNLTTTYDAQQQHFSTDPNTGAAWTSAGFDASEVGVSNTTAVAARCTSCFVSVDFVPSAGGGGTTVSPSTGINDAQGNTPTIGLQKTARPTAGINNIVGAVPTISFGGATTVSPLAGINNVVGQVPTIGKQKTFSPSTGNVRNVGNTPTITWQLTILAATSANHIIGNAPSITFGALAAITVSPATGNVSNYGSTPLIQTGIWTPVQLNTSVWTPDTDQSSTWTANIPASTVWS